MRSQRWHPVLCNYNQGSTRLILTSYHSLVLSLFVFEGVRALPMIRAFLKPLIMLITSYTYLPLSLLWLLLLVRRILRLLLLLNTVEFLKFLL